MISAIIVLVAIVGLAYLGTMLSQYPGYVEIGLSSGSFQMPIWYFLLALILLVVVAMISFKLIWTLIRIPAISKRFGKNRREAKTGHLLQKGMLAMGKGQWKKAENILAKGARLSYKGKQDTGLFLTAAAQAAQQQGADARRDQYLLEARQLAAEGQDTFSAALSEAQLHIDADEAQQALSVLQPHHTLNYENPRLQALESQAYEQLGQYDEVWRLLKNQRKAYPNKQAYQARQSEVAKSLFNSMDSSIDSVEKVWSEMPKADKKDDTVILSYVSALINGGEKAKAETVLSKAIGSTFADPLIHAYTQLDTGSSRERLKKMSNWVRSRPDNAYLNYGAAKLAFQSEELEKAKEYAERSVQSQPLPEALALLGKIYEALGQENNALKAYRTSLGLTYVEEQPVVSGEVLAAPEGTKALTGEVLTDDKAVEAKVAEDVAKTVDAEVKKA